MTRFAKIAVMGTFAFLLLTAPVAAQDSQVNYTTTAVSPTEESPSQTGKGRTKQMQSQIRNAVKERQTAIKESLDDARVTFKERLAEIKDAQKQQALTRIDAKLASINAKRTMHMEEVLTKLQKILNRVSEKGEALKAADVDTTALDRAVASATTALETAKENVATQKAKEYIPEITTETTLRRTVGVVVSGLQTDLRSVHASVVAAKQAVMKAAMELAKLNVTPTVSGNPTGVEE